MTSLTTYITDQLSESEKQTITFLSQLADDLAAGVVGDSTASSAIGADIGKRAVENNFFDMVLNFSELKRKLINYNGFRKKRKVMSIKDFLNRKVADNLEKYYQQPFCLEISSLFN
ncbi:hypothetical protein GVX76_09240 [[Haemophilus] felis]|nr:hypothetical protein [[Haemophilus] felis]